MIAPYFTMVGGNAATTPRCENYSRLDDTYFNLTAQAVDDVAVASMSAWIFNVGGPQTVNMTFDGTYWHGSYVAPPGEGNLSYADVTVVDNTGLGTTQEILLPVTCAS